MSDLVRRQDVYDLIIKTFKDEEDLYKAGVLATGVNLLPTAEAEPVVHGEWEILTDEYDCEYMRCSACNEEFYPADEDTVDKLYNYCPNCGAKMDGGV